MLVNLCTYFFASLTVVCFVDWESFSNIQSWSFAAVVYLSFSTVIAYTALGEAIKYLPVSLISLLIVTNPFVTILGVELLHLFQVTYISDVQITVMGFLGTILAISGVGFATLKGLKRTRDKA